MTSLVSPFPIKFKEAQNPSTCLTHYKQSIMEMKIKYMPMTIPALTRVSICFTHCKQSIIELKLVYIPMKILVSLFLTINSQ